MKKKIMYLIAATVMTCMISTTASYAKEEVVVPAEVIEISEELGGRYSICPELIQAICWTESRFRPDVESKGCIGIMQVYEKYHKDRMKKLKVADLYDMRGNMTVAVDYLAELFEQYECDIVAAIASYHGERNIHQISPYTEGILELSAELEIRNGK